jgi:hypothetical protein
MLTDSERSFSSGQYQKVYVDIKDSFLTIITRDAFYLDTSERLFYMANTKRSVFMQYRHVLTLPIVIGFYHPLDGVTNLKYNFLCFLTPDKKYQRERHYHLTGIDAAI